MFVAIHTIVGRSYLNLIGIMAQHCGTYKHPRYGCILLAKELRGGSLFICKTPTHLRSIINTTTNFTDRGRMED